MGGGMAVEWAMGGGGDAGEGERAVEEAVYAGKRSLEELVRLLSQNPNREEEERTCMRVADAAVAKFKKVISLLDRSRTGHARFRRSPVVGRENEEKKAVVVAKEEKDELVVPVKIYCPKPIQRIPPLPHPHLQQNATRVFAAANSSLTGPCTSSSAFQVMATPASAAIERVPPPPSSSAVSLPLKNKCVMGDENGGGFTSGKCLSGPTIGRCHCSNTKKSRKLKVRRSVRVPAISVKPSDIPSDEFSWRKYGQKPIKGSPYPRGYYKCSSVRGCPARKHVERAVDDPSMLVVTYEDDHNHVNHAQSHIPIAVPAPKPPTVSSSPPSSSPPPAASLQHST